MYKTIKILAGILMLISVSSCNKYLDLKPQDGITRDEFWQTKEQVESAVFGCYSAMLGANGDKALAEYLFMYGELRADMIVPNTTGISNNENDIINDNITPDNPIVSWAVFYKIINYCNTVIDYAPGVLKTDNTFTKTQLNGYVSEALAIRALMYFYLVRSFGDVPLKLQSTSSDSDLKQLAKSPANIVLKQIVADLQTAEAGAVETYGDNASDRGRITKYTINTIQADVYLWMDDYANCIAACDKVINSGRYGLIAWDGSWFNTLYFNGNSNEGILELEFDKQILNPFYNMFLTSKRRYLATPAIMDDFYTIDPVNDENKDIRGIDAAVHIQDLTIWKYVGFDRSTTRTTDASFAHWIIYRYADVLLMKAEACAQSGRGQDALDIITTIRTRANALPGSAQSPAPDDVSGLTDYILAERAREFAFEGKRWYDLLRNAKRDNYARLDILLKAATASVPPDLQQSALNKLKDPNNHYFPINRFDITTDPNLVQNPFYK